MYNKEEIRWIIFALIVFGIICFGKYASAGELSLGYGYTNGHSDSQGRCINAGQHVDVTASMTVIDTKFFLLGVGQVMTLSQYEGASRLKASGPQSAPYDIETENSLTMALFVKPTVYYSNFYVFGIAGPGVDSADQDGSDYGYLVGYGAGYEINDSMALEFSRRTFYRNDTGFLRHYTMGLIFKF